MSLQTVSATNFAIQTNNAVKLERVKFRGVRKQASIWQAPRLVQRSAVLDNRLHSYLVKQAND